MIYPSDGWVQRHERPGRRRRYLMEEAGSTGVTTKMQQLQLHWFDPHFLSWIFEVTSGHTEAISDMSAYLLAHDILVSHLRLPHYNRYNISVTSQIKERPHKEVHIWRFRWPSWSSYSSWSRASPKIFDIERRISLGSIQRSPETKFPVESYRSCFDISEGTDRWLPRKCWNIVPMTGFPSNCGSLQLSECNAGKLPQASNGPKHFSGYSSLLGSIAGHHVLAPCADVPSHELRIEMRIHPNHSRNNVMECNPFDNICFLFWVRSC
jgi:hypothetical protein